MSGGSFGLWKWWQDLGSGCHTTPKLPALPAFTSSLVDVNQLNYLRVVRLTGGDRYVILVDDIYHILLQKHGSGCLGHPATPHPSDCSGGEGGQDDGAQKEDGDGEASEQDIEVLFIKPQRVSYLLQ